MSTARRVVFWERHAVCSVHCAASPWFSVPFSERRRHRCAATPCSFLVNSVHCIYAVSTGLSKNVFFGWLNEHAPTLLWDEERWLQYRTTSNSTLPNWHWFCEYLNSLEVWLWWWYVRWYDDRMVWSTWIEVMSQQCPHDNVRLIVCSNENIMVVWPETFFFSPQICMRWMRTGH